MADACVYFGGEAAGATQAKPGRQKAPPGAAHKTVPVALCLPISTWSPLSRHLSTRSEEACFNAHAFALWLKTWNPYSVLLPTLPIPVHVPTKIDKAFLFRILIKTRV
jgi:hypothetical protein